MIKNHKLYQSIVKHLLQPSFLEKIGLDREDIFRQLQSPYFIKEIERISNEEDYRSQSIYRACEKILEELWGKAHPQDPLYYIYQYALSYSFPNSVEIHLVGEWETASLYFLQILRVVCYYERLSNTSSMISKYSLDFFTDEECKIYKVSKEYKEFKKLFQEQYIYEMMKLNQDILKFNTLDHICGVHYLALFIGKQLYHLGLPVDLGRVSGASAGHDLGKYGCKSHEGNRVPYLHYYYTDQWFKKHHIPYIGHIALNHSVWDLELENLPLESILLIYADFRVKNKVNAQGELEMTIFSLKDSFQVILNKLDNVDHEKEKRYMRVYNKLKDFEEYIQHIGIEIDPTKNPSPSFIKEKEYYSLMRGNKITQHLKYLTIHHTIYLMDHFRTETSLNEILEVIRSENDPKNLREYLGILREYSTYFTQKQKVLVLKFLYENLTNPEEDIRRQSTELMGILIALFDEDYRKEIPQGVSLPSPDINTIVLLDEYLQSFIYPDYKMIPLHRQWIGYNLKILIPSVLKHCRCHQEKKMMEVILNYFTLDKNYETYITISLLDIVDHLPLEKDEKYLSPILDYIEGKYYTSIPALRIASLKAIEHLIVPIKEREEFFIPLKNILTTQQSEYLMAENYLKIKIIEQLDWNLDLIKEYCPSCNDTLNKVSSLYLSNLKTGTNWMIKKVQVQMLLEYFLKGEIKDGLYIAIHYTNLIKVSAVESVRNATGKALVKILPYLPTEQQNDIAIELLRSLELEGYQFTKYIPEYLGQVLLFLQPYELDEIIKNIQFKIKQSNNQIKSLLLKAVGYLIINYPNYKRSFEEEAEIYEKRQQRLLGVLLNGLSHDEIQIRQISFSVLGKEIFGSNVLNLKEKHTIFQIISKKVLTLITDNRKNQLLFLINSAGLNHIYRFISNYSFEYDSICVKSPSKVAFFPGTFDPFTQGHKEVCRAIRDQGFEVYLAVDEFSWSKRTQPHLIRKNIINMSIAEERDIYLYPEDFPVNIANPKDLKTLRENLNSHQVFIVVGSDVILNASAYKTPSTPESIHQFPHVIFERQNDPSEHVENVKKTLKKINGEIVHLNIPPQYEDVSSTQIRNYIDKNIDISKLIDPLAQKYIYENHLYRREPQYKSIIQSISIEVVVLSEPHEEVLQNIIQTFHRESQKFYKNIKEVLSSPQGKIILIHDIKNHNKLLAYSIFHEVSTDQIYQEWKDSKVSQVVRENYKGKIISLHGFFVQNIDDPYQMFQILLTETFSYCLKNDYGYAVYHNIIDEELEERFINLIHLQGFVKIGHNDNKPILAVDMTHPCTLNLDIETVLKEPYRSNDSVQKVIHKTRIRLQKALTNLYPGNLVMSFDVDMTHEILAKKICEENGVSPIPIKPRRLGPLMCVPFGHMLNRVIVPNTVTKSLHVEKMFHPNMKHFTIGAYPYYLDLNNQVKMIHSFRQPVILLDDLLHKGYRIKGLDPLLKKHNIKVHKIMVGILSGRGKELMDIQNRQVDSAYFIPKLRLWFNENYQYPFVGGDTLWRGIYPKKNLLPSVNLILPYTSPHFIKGVTNRGIYQLSEVSILNAIDLLQLLEQQYQKINERKLTLSLLGDIFYYPRYPDIGEKIYYDLTENPSSYVENSLELLKKLEHSIITGDMQRIYSDGGLHPSKSFRF